MTEGGADARMTVVLDVRHPLAYLALDPAIAKEIMVERVEAESVPA